MSDPNDIAPGPAPGPDDETPMQRALRLKQAAHPWRDCADMSDQRLFNLIRKDCIDILVDLTGHSAGGARLKLIARKPAPVQMLYLGYPNTSGLTRIDYVIADSYTYPESAGALFSEAPLRPSPCFLCFKPPADAPPVSTLPELGTTVL